MKRWLGKLLKNDEAPTGPFYPPSKVLNFWIKDPGHKSPVLIPSRSNPGFSFTVNLFEMSCTCPGFRRDRMHYGPKDVRRVCPHMIEAVKKASLVASAHPLSMLIAQHGRRYHEFHRQWHPAIRAEVAYGFNSGQPDVGVYAVLNIHDTTHGTFDLTHRNWAKPPATEHVRVLSEVVTKTFFKPSENVNKDEE